MECDEMVEDGDHDDSGDQMSKVNDTRLSRKLNEKMRRDRLNGLIAELAEEVPTIKYAHRRLDKSSVLRLTVSFLKLHQGLKYKTFTRDNIFKARHVYKKVSNYMMSDGMLMVLSQSGMILYVSPAVKQILGYHQSDVIGFDISRFIHPDDVSSFIPDLEDNSSCDKEAVFATFDRDGEIKQPHKVHIVGPQKNTFYARMMKISKRKKDRGEEDSSEQDQYDLMQVKTYREKQENIRPGEEPWIVANVKPFAHESIKEMSVSISEFQKNNEWATMHSLDGKILASEQRASLIHGFLVSELLGKSPYVFISDDDLEYVCRSHQLILTDEEIPSTVFRMKTIMGSSVYVQSRSIIIKDKWTKQPKCIVSVNEILNNDSGQKMLEYQKQRVEELTKASETQSAADSEDELEENKNSDSLRFSELNSEDSRISEDSDMHSCSSDSKTESVSLNKSLSQRDEVLEIHRYTGKSLSEIYEEKVISYHSKLQQSENLMSSLCSDSVSFSVKRSHDCLDGEKSDSSMEISSDESQSSGNVGNVGQSLYQSELCGQKLPNSSASEKTEKYLPVNSTASRPILKGILEGRLTFVGQNKYKISQAESTAGSPGSQGSTEDWVSKCTAASSNTSQLSESDGSLAAMSPASCEAMAAESCRPVLSDCPANGSVSVLEDSPLCIENSDIFAHLTRQLLTKYGLIKSMFSSHKLTITELREHLEKAEVIKTLNYEQQLMHQGLISRLRQAESQLNIQDQLLKELTEELDCQNNSCLTY